MKLNREAMLAEMGVAIGVDGHTVGLFQPKRVKYFHTFSSSFHALVFYFIFILLCLTFWRRTYKQIVLNKVITDMAKILRRIYKISSTPL